MGTPFLGEIRTFSFNYAPKGWALCNGQILPIAQNQALFSLLGTTYGGNGTFTFALPNLQGSVPVHTDNSAFIIGQTGGEQSHTLVVAEMPGHGHTAAASTDAADVASPNGTVVWANPGVTAYDVSTTTTMSVHAVSNVGTGQPHDNMSPYLVVSFCIALLGIFPSRN